MELYISPQGNDEWTGLLAEPNSSGSDGPLATLNGARRMMRTLMQPEPKGQNRRERIGGPQWPLTIWVRGGIYECAKPVVFTPEDSFPLIFKACPGERPIFDGGSTVAGWQEVTWQGRTVWKAPWNESWDGRQLWVNGRRATRSRWPKADFLTIADPLNGGHNGWFDGGTARFVVAPDDWRDIEDVSALDVVALHFWVEERMPVTSYDPKTGVVTTGRRSFAPLNEAGRQTGARYFMENVLETLSEPGEWAYSATRGEVFYLPLPGETLETAVINAARIPQLLEIRGEPERGRLVEWLRFEGLTFRHTAAVVPGDVRWPESQAHSDDKSYRGAEVATAEQAAVDVPGVVKWRGARHCALVNCTVENAGWYGLELGAGCSLNHIVGNRLADLGAGGIHVFGRDSGGLATGNNALTDNEVCEYGQVFPSAVGVLMRHTAGNRVSHNQIHHGLYTAISAGWVWGFGRSLSHDNLIEWNHIHHIGNGLLSDMGGIYLLGVSPGTVVSHNLIHDIECAHYGGWAIYPDEGTSHVVIEKNLCYNTSSSVFHLHWGRENTVRNNVFAFGREAVIAVCRRLDCLGATFTRNILISDGAPIYYGGYAHDVTEPEAIETDCNLLWDVSRDLQNGAAIAQNPTETPEEKLVAAEASVHALTWRQWQASGRDRHSVVAAPGLTLPLQAHLELAPDSPAIALGFVPFDLSEVGPRSGSSQ